MAVGITVVRHGETGDNVLEICTGQTRNPDLTDKGCQQAEHRGQALLAGGRKFAAIYASPLLRSRRTASIVGKILGLFPVVILDGLKERFVGSAFETSRGVHMEVIFELVAEELRWLKTQSLEVVLDYHFKATPDAKTIREAAVRFKQALCEIASRHQDGQKVLVVAHSAVMGSTLIEMGLMDPAFDENPFGSAIIPNLGMMEFHVNKRAVTYIG